MAARDLCTLADVALLVPGYAQGNDTDTDAILSELITETSRAAMDLHSRREFKAIEASQPATRLFDMSAAQQRTGKLPIGDLANTTGLAVKLLDGQGNVAQTLTLNTDFVLLPRVREDWQPYHTIWFVNTVPFFWPNFQWGPPGTVQVTGTWGYPSVPTTVKDAVARLVIIEYVNDVAASGTPFAELVNRQEINLGAWFRRAMDALESHCVPSI